MSIGRLFAVVASVIGVLFAVPTASAAPPVITGVGYENGDGVRYGMWWVTWTLPPGMTSEFVQLDRSPDTSQGYEWPLSPDQTSWKGAVLEGPGTYYVRVSAAPTTCEGGPPCPSEWSAAVRFTVPFPLIVLGRSVEPVALGMTRARVGELVRRNSSGTWLADWGRLWIVFRGTPRRVIDVSTDSESYRVKGTRIRVGSSERALRRAISGVRCASSTRWQGKRYCWVGRRVRGRRVTVFEMQGRRVASFRVGFARYTGCHPFWCRTY